MCLLLCRGSDSSPGTDSQSLCADGLCGVLRGRVGLTRACYFAPFLRNMSTYTATRITQPTATDCHSCGTAVTRRPFVRTATMREPTTVPTIEPFPPCSD